MYSPIESKSGFGGLGVCVLASGTQDRGFAPDRSRRIFHNGKNPQHAVRLGRERTVEHKEHETNKQGKNNNNKNLVFQIIFTIKP
jgi:hypothetical protein